MSHVDGKKGALQPILKSSGASTLDIVSRIRSTFETLKSTLPQELAVTLMFDQSVFVREAVDGVIKEGVIAASLTGLMILLFLGSWRSTVIVVVSIPLSILTAIIVLSWLGQSLNLMTLGGMALAVGILVDDATVTIENIHRNLGEAGPRGGRKTLTQAIMDGASQIAVPAFVSTLCICIVFVPVVFIAGAAKSLFVPLALTVVIAMLMSYFLSRTLVPTLIAYLLKKEAAQHGESGHALGFFGRFHAGFERLFTAFQGAYGRVLEWALGHRLATACVMLAFVAISTLIEPLVGRDFFPTVDSGQFRLHVRCPPGTRIEASERYLALIEDALRQDIPPSEFAHVSDIIGIPNSSINLSLSDGSLASPADGEILVSLAHEHAPTAIYIDRIRNHLARDFPEVTIFFQAADITSQVLNFGLSAPIDIQLVGPIANQHKNLKYAEEIRQLLQQVPGAVDVHLNQVLNAPTLNVNIDRTQAQQAGLSQKDVATSLLISLSSSTQTAPNFWLNDEKGIQYAVSVQAPQYLIDSPESLGNIPVSSGVGSELLSNVSSTTRSYDPVNLTHYDATPTLDVLANVSSTDLGSVSDAVDRIVAKVCGADGGKLPRGTFVHVRGQVESMNSSFRGLSFGLIFAVVLVYLLMVVNFQSWTDPLIIIGAIPGALGGIVWMLFITQTTLSVPALMGAIMSIGVATANSILVVSFANDQRDLGLNAHDAARQAGLVRLRPVIMTAAAMIIGMIPMALGLSDGGEQNAPLGRAVIGGLILATLSTLFFVPVVYSALNRRPKPETEDDLGLAAHTPEGTAP
jgi:multidrug efflux pump subunit AcrB